MIDMLTGLLFDPDFKKLEVKVNLGSVQLLVKASKGLLERVQAQTDPEMPIETPTFLHWPVSGGCPSLYAFSTYEERDIFTKITKAKNVGPLTGLRALSVFNENYADPTELHEALRKMVGPKTADSIMVELASVK